MVARWLVVLAVCFGAASSCLFDNKCTDLFAKTSRSKYYEWVGVNIRFPCDSTRRIFQSSGFHIRRNLMPTRFQVNAFTNEVFIAMPRYKPGVAVTLAKAHITKTKCIPVFHPYPCFSLQEEGSCDAIQSAIDIVLDKLGRLWVLDGGVTNTLINPKRRCPPKILQICTLTHKVLRVIDLSALASPVSRLQYLVVDESVLGQTHVYVSDAATSSILVWDIFEDRGWKILLPPVVLDGINDVLYLSLVQHKDATTYLYFTYLSSSRMFYINTDFLQQRTMQGIFIDLGIKPKQLVLLGSDKGTKLFFRFQGDSFVYQWDTLHCFHPNNFELVHEGTGCRLATHVAPGFGFIMYGIETNFYDYIKNIAGCLGPSISLFPLVKTVNNLSELEPLQSIKETFMDIINHKFI